MNGELYWEVSCGESSLKIIKYYPKIGVVEFISLSHWIKSRINCIKKYVIWRITLRSLLEMQKLEKMKK